MVWIITIPHGGAISDIHDKMEIKAQRFIEKNASLRKVKKCDIWTMKQF